MLKVVESSANDNRKDQGLEGLVAALARLVDEQVGANCSFTEREAALLMAANEAVRCALQAELQRQADELGNELWIGGLLYRRHQPGTVRYFSLCGELKVYRYTYRHLGERNGPTLVPVELVTGLVEGATPALAYSLAQGYAKAPVRSVRQDLLAAHRSPPSRCTLERMAQAIGTKVKEKLCIVEPVVRQQEVVSPEAVAINLGLDRTTIPMAETEHAADGRPKIVVNYRMAYVGTVTLTDTEAEPLMTRRYAAPAHQGPHGVIARMMADLRHCLESKPELNIGVVQDGAPELWNLMRDALRADPALRQKGWRETVDFYHLMEYLARVLAVLVDDEAQRHQQLCTWRQALERSDRAIHRIRRWIDEKARHVPYTSRRYAEFCRVSGCYLIYTPHFKYASLKPLGLYRGSGVTEGACKSLIAIRAKRSGQRWRPTGIDAVLALRSLLDSDRLQAFWSLFAINYTRACIAA